MITSVTRMNLLTLTLLYYLHHITFQENFEQKTQELDSKVGLVEKGINPDDYNQGKLFRNNLLAK